MDQKPVMLYERLVDKMLQLQKGLRKGNRPKVFQSSAETSLTVNQGNTLRFNK